MSTFAMRRAYARHLSGPRIDSPPVTAVSRGDRVLHPEPDVWARQGDPGVSRLGLPPADAPRPASLDFEEALRWYSLAGQCPVRPVHARVRLGRTAEGVEDAEKALELDPQRETVLFSIACFYAQAAEQVRLRLRKVEEIKTVQAYQARAIELLRSAVDRLKPERGARVFGLPRSRTIASYSPWPLAPRCSNWARSTWVVAPELYRRTACARSLKTSPRGSRC